MAKRMLVIILLSSLVLLTGCDLFASPTVVQPTQPAASATASPMPLVVVITATPFAPAGEGTLVNPTAVVPFASPTTSPGAITITKVEDQGNGQALVNWTVNGDFPSGYQVVWSSVHENPTFPEDTSTYTSDSNARAALISGESGKIYYVRVCRVKEDSCDLYSNLGIFALFSKTKTPTSSYHTGGGSTAVPTYKATTYNSKGTPISSTNSIKITDITEAGAGKAHIYWTAVGEFTRGFKIVYSKTDSTPTFGEDFYYAIGDPKARDAYVDGDAGVKYYYRVCRYTGSTCDIYSATYTYTFPGTAATSTTDPAVITLNSVTETSPAVATVNWDATGGTFPSGFKILFSKTHTTPTLSDSLVYIADGALRTGTFTGTAGETYYVRVCKYYASTCVAYSNIRTITFAGPVPTADTSTITVTGVTDNLTLGEATINWTDTGEFLDGFKVMYSETNPIPTTADTVVVVGSSRATSATVTGMPDTTYYFAVCKNVGGVCGVYSNIVSHHFAADTASTISAPTITDTADGTAKVDWTASGTFTEGFKLLMSDTNTSPTLSDAVGSVIDGALRTGSITGTAGTQYYVRVCKVYGSGCSVLSAVTTFTFAKIDISSFANVSNGNATIDWTASGDFSNGFRVVYDEVTYPPTLSDNVVTVPGSGTRTADIAGTEGTNYYFRVCQWDGVSSCIIYSPVQAFTFATINITSASESSPGVGSLTWTDAGDFPMGFALIYALEKPVTDIATDGDITISGETTVSTTISTVPSVIPGTTIHYKLCQLIASSTCGVYSNEVTIAYAPEMTLSFDDSIPGQSTISWTPPGSSPSNGFVILRGAGASDPINDAALGTALSGDSSYIDATIVSGSSYTYRVCGYNGTYYTSCSAATAHTMP